MFTVGRICVKIAGRDAGRRCVIVEESDDGMVVIDGQTRRRKCNIRHLEPTALTVDLKAGATRAQVKAALEKLSIEVRDTKPKKPAARPRKAKAKKEAPVLPEKKQVKKPALDAQPATPAPVVETPVVEKTPQA